ncbi:MAG: hypothetical protein HDT22_03170 [Ruminococcus sp.]|nr:hypothetical protein [Ruminococcus sp.]
MVKEKLLRIGSAFIGIMMMLQVVPIKDISTKALQIKESNTDIVVSSEYLAGDVNGDGIFSVTDIVVLQKWLHGKGNLECWQNADLNQDSIINIFDLCLMKKMIVKSEMEKQTEDLEFHILSESWTRNNVYDIDSKQVYVALSYDELCKTIENIEQEINFSSDFNSNDYDEDNIFLIVYTSVGASNRTITIDNIKKENENLFVYTTVENSVPTPDMAICRFIVEVNQEKISGLNGILIENKISNLLDFLDK